jgi:hypothetical protein
VLDDAGAGKQALTLRINFVTRRDSELAREDNPDEPHGIVKSVDTSLWLA